ncbi:YtxH domain-containing protein [Cytophagales bacterium RKSG123]|nr:YtxH domain-containing protein [Xanthovirga aplysinae]MTI32601.1 YtxH domain-containing protein [Xanthovirga aplysinae]
MKTLRTVFISFLVGAAAGTAAGLLFAPEKGERTRRRLRRRAEDLRDNIEETLETQTAKVQDFKESALSKAGKMGKRLTNNLNIVKKQKA